MSYHFSMFTTCT